MSGAAAVRQATAGEHIAQEEAPQRDWQGLADITSTNKSVNEFLTVSFP